MSGILEWTHALLDKKDKREAMMTQDALRKKAENLVQSVTNSPEGRLQLRKRFYRKFGYKTIVTYGKNNWDGAFQITEKELKLTINNKTIGFPIKDKE